MKGLIYLNLNGLYALQLILTHELSVDRWLDDITSTNILLFFYTKQIDSLLLWVCSGIDYKRYQNVI